MGFPYESLTSTVITSTAAFSANQVMGTGVQSFATTPFGGFVQGININLNSTNANQVDFCVFTSSMPNTTFTDHSSIAISSADFASMGPVVNVTNWAYMGTNAVAGYAGGLAYPFYKSHSATEARMFWALVARGAVTVNSTNGISVTITYIS